MFEKKDQEVRVEREDGLIDYDVYVMTKKEKALYIVLAALCIFVVGMIFYHKWYIAAIIALFCLKFPRIRTQQIISNRKRELNIQFKDMLYALSSSMVAGKSIETAFRDLPKDLAVIYPDPDTTIMKEVLYIIRRLEMNVPLELILDDFAARTHIEDIENFSDVFRTTKKAGGNIVEVIRTTSNMIGDKIEVKEDIETLITAKKFESRVLAATPIVMVALLSYASPEYMEKVFTTAAGNIVMTIAIVLFVISFFIAEKIMKIEV